MKKRQIRKLGRRVVTAVTGFGLAAAAMAQTSNPFDGTELAAAEGVTTGFLAVGAAITIALVVYRLGKRAINRV